MIQQLKHSNIYGFEAGFSYALIRSVQDATGIHSHDFYEFFIITQGRVLHHVNNQVQNLVEGSLIFIRPSDVHFYEKADDTDCQFINFTFTCEVFKSIQSYLGQDDSFHDLHACVLPPHTILSKARTDEIVSDFHKLNTIQSTNKKLTEIEMKLLLIKLTADFFHDTFRTGGHPIPYWLSFLCRTMQKKEYFTEGIPRLLSISGKSHEHLCREFKRYLGTTPVSFINELRLNYAKNLLANSDENIIHIAMEAGFNNLSHFNHLFKKRYGMSPMECRKKTQNPLTLARR